MKRDTTLINQHENKLPPNIMISNNLKTDRHDITEILLKVALNTITLNPNPIFSSKTT
jgi:hypothetical protein